MARVPTYDNFQVTPQGGSMPAVGIPDVAGAQLQKVGEGMQSAGNSLTRIVVDMMKESNQLRVDDAINQVRDEAYRLTYDKDAGYTTQRGRAALERKSGKLLHDEYAEELNKRVQDISATLGNDAQRQAFLRSAGGLLTSFRGDAMKHTVKEYVTFKGAALDGAMENLKRDLSLNFSNPDRVEEALHGKYEDVNGTKVLVTKGIKQVALEKAQLEGMDSADFVEAFMRKHLSDAHKLALSSALDKGDLPAAHAYLKKYKDQMDADDLLKVSHLLTAQSEKTFAANYASKAVNWAYTQVSPGDMTRIYNITVQSESAGRRYGKDGRLLESPKGAKGEYQVLDSTNRDPGYGVKPAKDNSPDERARVGRDYLAALLKEYGDPAKMWAAYNYGPGNFNKAMKAAEAEGVHWMTKMPAETVAYVNKNMKALTAGGGMPRKPTLMELHAEAEKAAGPNATPTLIKAMRDEVTRRYEDMNKALEQRKTDLVERTQRELLANGGIYDNLPASLRMEIGQFAPDKVDDLQTYGTKIRKGQESVTDWDVYTNLRAMAANEPDKFAQTDLRLHFPNLSAKDRETLIDLQTKLRDPSKKHQVMSLTQQLSTAHNLMNFKSSDREKKGRFDNAVATEIAAKEKIKGAPLDYKERDDIIKRMMLPTNAGFFGGKRMYEIYGTADQISAKPKISTEEDRLIRIALLKEGIEPTEETITARFKLRYGLK